MIDSLLNLLVFCSHQQTSFPQKAVRDVYGRPLAIRPAEAHVTCLECGKEFPYSWERMRIEPPAMPAHGETNVTVRALVPDWTPPQIRQAPGGRSRSVAAHP
jgi:hypothetical protein